MNTSTKQINEVAIWTLTKFASALREHDGETCNEIHCASHYEAECLVDLLNEKEQELSASKAETKKLREELAEIKEIYANIVNQPHFDELEVHCSCVPALREEVARLGDSARFWENQAIHFQDACKNAQDEYTKLLYTAQIPLGPKDEMDKMKAEVARLRWEIKKGDFDGKPYLWDNQRHDNYDLGTLCQILNEYEARLAPAPE